MSVKFEFDFEDFEELRLKLEQVDSDLEKELNTVLKTEGKRTVEPKITNLIRVSTPSRGAKKNGPHAKNSKWARQEMGNLELTIKAKGGAANKPGSFGYLVFPNEGRGPRNHREQRFMENGRDAALPELVDKTNEKLLEIIEEAL